VKPNKREHLEVELDAAIARGASQYVILGAGLDTHAYRKQNSHLRVFEIGHTGAQTHSLRSALDAAGFHTGEVSFFSWLGGSPYSSAQATIDALAFIGSLPAGSGLVFDYAARRTVLDPELVAGEETAEVTAMDPLASRIAVQGQPQQLFLDSHALDQLLRAVGFREVEDSRVPLGLAHLVSARV
jgi:O-methyltransferase involved in polyketide biosynthesis